MIKFALACDKGHDFESWFPDGAAYQQQAERGLIACPDCGSTRVDKAIMAPAIVGAVRPEREQAAAAPVPVALIDERRRALREAARALRREIEAHTDDVGAEFPRIARAMHAGEAPERAIRGEASRAEVEALIEDGVDVMPLPFAPEDFN